jgi:hypothetical protein
VRTVYQDNTGPHVRAAESSELPVNTHFYTLDLTMSSLLNDLPHNASAVDVHRRFQSYAVLVRYRRSHPAVRRLVNAIYQHRRRFRLLTPDDAFDAHRALKLGLPAALRVFPITTAIVVETAAMVPAPVVAAGEPNEAEDGQLLRERRSSDYRHQLMLAMHYIARQVKDSTLRPRAYLDDNAINLVILYLHREQGPWRGRFLALNSLYPIDYVTPDLVVDGRVVSSASVLVRLIYIRNHWAAAVWYCQRPGVVFMLDSASLLTTDNPTVQDFVALCQVLHPGFGITVESLPVAQQDDGYSCGLFVVEFCFILALTSGFETVRRQLLHVDVSGTRAMIKELQQKLCLGPQPFEHRPSMRLR